ncbi:MAG TPA: peptide ABC transporter substrate-binding protein, partial [Anaerolineae bacterium]|nr:peptide ABC transporter substrate-binding protein [Anaerolineae bacterium]
MPDKRQNYPMKTTASLLSRRLVILLLSTLLLLSCQLFTGALTSTKTSPNEDTIYLMGHQPRTMDPARTLGGPDSPLGHIFSGLVAIDTDMQVQPELAAGWEVSDNGRIYTFYLRKNAVFHDGRPVTAADVIYAWERAADPATGSDTVLTYLGDVAGVAEMNSGQADSISGL